MDFDGDLADFFCRTLRVFFLSIILGLFEEIE